MLRHLQKSSDFDSCRADLGYLAKYLVSPEDDLVPMKSRTIAILLTCHFRSALDRVAVAVMRQAHMEGIATDAEAISVIERDGYGPGETGEANEVSLLVHSQTGRQSDGYGDIPWARREQIAGESLPPLSSRVRRARKLR